MNFDQFTGQVQNRLELPGTGEAVRAIRATLTTLGERLQAGEAEDLAGSLPMEVDFYLTGAVRDHGQRFDWGEFVDRVREREGATDRRAGADAAYHARVVVALMADVVAPGEMRQIRSQLPADEGWDQLFELVDD
jgi:uncharacterized protein (DUF2267 family)